MLSPKWTPKQQDSAVKCPPSQAPTSQPRLASSSSSISTPSSPPAAADFVLEVRDDRQRISRSRHSSANSSVSAAQVSRFGLGFEKGTRIFEAGESIKGQVVLCLTAPLLLRRIRVQLEGRAHILQSPAGLACQDVRLDRERFFFVSCTPFGSDLDYAFNTTDGNFILQTGEYEFHFDIPLESSVLPSVNAMPVFTITYICSAHVECGPQHEQLITCNCNLKVRKSIDLGHLGDRLQATHFNKSIRLSAVLPDALISESEDGFVDVDFGMSSGVALCGLPISASGHIRNRTGLAITSVTVAIMQRVALRLPPTSGQRSSSTSSLSLSVSGFDEEESEEWAEAVVTSHDFGSIEIGERLVLEDGVLRLPQDHVILPVSRDARKSFRCIYCVRLKIKFQAKIQLHMVTFDMPLSVGHSVSGAPLSPMVPSDEVF